MRAAGFRSTIRVGTSIGRRAGSSSASSACAARRSAGPRVAIAAPDAARACAAWTCSPSSAGRCRRSQKIFPDVARATAGRRAPATRCGAARSRVPARSSCTADRPLISENAHEHLHPRAGPRRDARPAAPQGGLDRRRARRVLLAESLRRSGRRSPSALRADPRAPRRVGRRAKPARSTPELVQGASTARAVGILRAVDAEIRAASGGRAEPRQRGRGSRRATEAVTLDMFRASAERHAGRALASLQPAALKAAPAAP